MGGRRGLIQREVIVSGAGDDWKSSSDYRNEQQQNVLYAGGSGGRHSSIISLPATRTVREP